MADLPIAPGEVYIEVEYDYEYKAKERLINIQQGECFLLVKKTNEDWWQVRKEEGSKAFYVPAHRAALMLGPGLATWCWSPLPTPVAWPGASPATASHPPPNSPGHVSPPGHRRDSNHLPPHSPTSDPHRALADVVTHSGGAGCPPQHGQKSGGCDTLPRNRARSPELARQPLDVDSAGESVERRTNDSESGDELSSSSTEHLQLDYQRHRGLPLGLL
ncbi:hypothetical protein CRUP_019364 [Coryphaenoides rupestris]|nr:hypothetical protein CRUP_019364 [Coryphaenoides rupestris]